MHTHRFICKMHCPHRTCSTDILSSRDRATDSDTHCACFIHNIGDRSIGTSWMYLRYRVCLCLRGSVRTRPPQRSHHMPLIEFALEYRAGFLDAAMPLPRPMHLQMYQCSAERASHLHLVTPKHLALQAVGLVRPLLCLEQGSRNRAGQAPAQGQQ